MPAILICSPQPLDKHLEETVLWQDDIERYVVSSAEEARERLGQARVNLLAVHRDVPDALQLVRSVRQESDTRRLSLAILAPAEFDPGELELLEAGANAILRFPATPEWNERLTRLMDVPVRKAVRFPVHLGVLAYAGATAGAISATALNLSERGMLLESKHAPRLREDLDFQFQIPGEPTLVKGCGRVVRFAPRNAYGIEFDGLEGDAPGQIRSYLDGLAPSAP
jgi:CheY-like chemotaxis protein